MLTLRKRSWHARLFLQAYVEDREWLDHPFFGGEWQDKSDKEAAVVRERLESGFMSICPYFWKTVYALVVYCFVAVPVYATRNFLRANWRLVPAFMAGVLITAFIGGTWWMRGDIAALPDKIAAWYHAQEAVRAESREFLEAYDRRVLAGEAFLRAHPEEAARVRARHVAFEKEWAEKEAKERAEVLAQFKADLTKAAPWLIGIALATTLLFTFTPLLKLLLAALVLLVFIPLEKTRWGMALLELFGAVFWWLTNLPDRIWRAAKHFIRDTWQFLGGYIMAVKERVCPFITFVDRGPAS